MSRHVMEALTVTLSGGDVTIYPEDDGVNASGSYIWISSGTLTIVNQTGNDADGLDSNGDIYISGGDVRISLLNSGSNSAIDYASESGGVCEISDGTVAAAGSSQTAFFNTDKPEELAKLMLQLINGDYSCLKTIPNHIHQQPVAYNWREIIKLATNMNTEINTDTI